MENILELKIDKRWCLPDNYYNCELTDEMDEYRTFKGEYNHTYIMYFGKREDGKEGHVYVIRLPGATRGCIYTDANDIIESIYFYKDTCYETFNDYNIEMEKIKDKYIGRKITYATDEEED